MLCLSGFELYSRWVPLRHEFVLGFSHLLMTKSLHSNAGCTEEIKA